MDKDKNGGLSKDNAQKIRQYAKHRYGGDEIDIDEDARLSTSELGAFVAVWAWVSYEDAEVQP